MPKDINDLPVLDMEESVILTTLGRRHARQFSQYGNQIADGYEAAQWMEDWRTLKNLASYLQADFLMTCSEVSPATRGRVCSPLVLAGQEEG